MPDTWTITNSLIYLVPLIIAVLVVMIYGAAENLAHAGIRCPECGHRFENEFALKRHLKDVERTRGQDRKKAA